MSELSSAATAESKKKAADEPYGNCGNVDSNSVMALVAFSLPCVIDWLPESG
jgi:hypothetical protein